MEAPPSLSFRVSQSQSFSSRRSSFDIVSSETESFDDIAEEEASDEEQIVYPKSSSADIVSFLWSADPPADIDPPQQDADDDFVVLEPRPNRAALVAVGSAPLSRPVTDPAALAAADDADPRFPVDDLAGPPPASPSEDVTLATSRLGRNITLPVVSAAKKEKRARKRKAKKAKIALAKAAAAGGGVPTTSAPAVPKAGKRKKGGKAPSPVTEIAPAGFGSRLVVEDDVKGGFMATLYEEAVRYITSFLKNPSEDDRHSRLALLQALIIELGLYTPPASAFAAPPTSFAVASDLPRSLRAAKAFLKSHVFLNVRDYLNTRDQGLSALKQAMHPDRASLRKSLRKPANRVPVQWVKESGLSILLVSWHH